MDGVGSLAREYPDEVRVVRNYLRSEVPRAELAESEDFERDGLLFRIEPRRLVFVSHEFLSDFSPDRAKATLRQFGVGARARSLPIGFMLMVTTDGTFVEALR